LSKPKQIPTDFFDMLPIPIAVLELKDNTLKDNTLNHPMIYLNSSFNRTIGWNLNDIPDKEHWWAKAYPDPSYQKTVENLWELYIESASYNDESFAMMTVNITTKYHGVKRFKVHTELKSALIDGYYVVAFKEVDD
jgi:hypothetical protein